MKVKRNKRVERNRLVSSRLHRKISRAQAFSLLLYRNRFRIGVGLAATLVGAAGYYFSRTDLMLVPAMVFTAYWLSAALLRIVYSRRIARFNAEEQVERFQEVFQQTTESLRPVLEVESATTYSEQELPSHEDGRKNYTEVMVRPRVRRRIM